MDSSSLPFSTFTPTLSLGIYSVTRQATTFQFHPTLSTSVINITSVFLCCSCVSLFIVISFSTRVETKTSGLQTFSLD